MYQIFVVEDELLIRQNIRHIVEGLGAPYTFCGEAADGEIALSVMQDVMPDILLTDIRMPFLDGLELIRHARQTMPWLKVIIISGFDDFDYAKRAMSLNVSSYLLKPVKAAELKTELDRIAAEIDSEKNTASLPAGYDPSEVNTALKQSFVRSLFYGTSDTGSLLDKARSLNLDILRPHYRCAIFSFDSEAGHAGIIREKTLAILQQQGIDLWFFSQPTELSVLLFDNDQEALSDRLYRLAGIIKHTVSTAVTCVLSVNINRLSGVSEAWTTSADLLKKAGSFFVGQVLDATDTAQLIAEVAGTASSDDILYRKLRYAAPEEIPALLDEMLTGSDSRRYDSMLTRYYTLIEILKIVIHMIERSTPRADSRDIASRLSEKYDIFTASSGKDTFRACAEALLNEGMDSTQESSVYLRHSHVVSRAEAYLADTFCDPNTTLISVANHVGMSPAHFSTVFSQTMGQTFINYLTNKRIEKAKELLTETDMKLSDIAMEIGYNESNYFSHVFRKSVGITPTDYRNQNMKG